MAGIFGTQGIWTCGFDFFATGSGVSLAGGVFDFANLCNVGPTFARFSGNGIQYTAGGFLQRTLNVNLPTMVAGFAFYANSYPVAGPSGFISFNDTTAGAPQFGLCLNTNGSLQFYKTNPLNNITLPTNPVGPASNAGTITAGSYQYIEIFCTVSSGSGQLIVNVNGTQALTFTGNTKATANAWVSQIQIGEAGAAGNFDYRFDDLYLLDTTAPAPLNTFLGPVRIQTSGPNADSATPGLNQWAFTTPQGTDFGNAANIPANIAQYNFDSTVGDRMSFRFPTVTALTYALNMWYSAEIDAAGTRSLVGIYRNNGNDQVGASPGNLNSSYTFYNQSCTIDPNTGQPWTSGPQGAINTCEIGLKVNS